MIHNKELFKKMGVSTKTKLFKTWYNAGLLNDIDRDFVKEVKKYWRDKTKKKIDPALHIAYMNLTGKKEVRLVPSNIMHYEVFPVLEDHTMTSYYGDKNIYDLLVESKRSATTVLRNIRGRYFDLNYRNIEPEEAENILLNNKNKLIIKPSQSNNGQGIKKLNIINNKIYIADKKVDIYQLLNRFQGNFIIQEMLEQHANMAAPHPASVNTLRMVTFRWKNEVKYLFAFARFGSNEDIRDNASVDTSPRVAITDSGEFFAYGLSQNLEKFTHHPTTGFNLSELKPIPNYDEFKQFVIDSHKNFLHLDYVSWDIAVGIDSKPIFIEANFAGSTSFYQLITQRPMLGEQTDEVMDHVKNELKSKKPILAKYYAKRQAARIEDRRNNEMSKLEKENDFLQKEVESYREQLDRHRKEYDKLKQSSSWKVTAPMRKVGKLLKKNKS